MLFSRVVFAICIVVPTVIIVSIEQPSSSNPVRAYMICIVHFSMGVSRHNLRTPASELCLSLGLLFQDLFEGRVDVRDFLSGRGIRR